MLTRAAFDPRVRDDALKNPSPILFILQILLAAACTTWLTRLIASEPRLANEVSESSASFLRQHCFECHQGEKSAAGFDASQLSRQLDSQPVVDRWIKIYEQLERGSMPPAESQLDDADRAEFLQAIAPLLDEADYKSVIRSGRGPLRRLNRSEYALNLRDLLQLPNLDIKDLLPEDRESHHFNKSAESLDMTRVQLAAYLDAADAALRQAVAASSRPRSPKQFRALATQMFPKAIDHAGRESSFYAKGSRMVPLSSSDLAKIRQENTHDPEMEVAIFRSASWPYYGYPENFVAEEAGVYRVRFSARAVRQLRDFRLAADTRPLAMTFRARKRSQADVSGDVRAVGGLLDVGPQPSVFETSVVLKPQETIEYSLMGLPVPFPITSHGGPLYYDFPPMPEGGHRGIAFRWLEIEGPIDSDAAGAWPPDSHRVLFSDLPLRDAPQSALGIEVVAEDPRSDALRLLHQFASRAARRPIAAESLSAYTNLIYQQLDDGRPFAESMLAGYQAFLCSSHFLYLREPGHAEGSHELASRLSHFLWNTRPDAMLESAASQGSLTTSETLRSETERLIASSKFDNFIDNFTDYWLDLKHVKRDSPDIRLYPEYRFDDYLIESMERETKSFVATMVRENLPVSSLVQADFVMVNDRLARHYELPDVDGSYMRKVHVPSSSPYGGLITQAALMKVTSNGTTTSPVIRGAWIVDRLLGDPPPPPPEKVPAIEPDIRGATTIRQQIAKHAEAVACAGCHAKFDSVGFALENFDVLGGWRERYRSLEKGDKVTGIDRAGHTYAYWIASKVESHGRLTDGRSFADVRGLKQLLCSAPRKLAANMIRQWTVYATGTPLRFSERREMDEILDRCAAAGYRVKDLLHEFVDSRIFTGAARANSNIDCK